MKTKGFNTWLLDIIYARINNWKIKRQARADDKLKAKEKAIQKHSKHLRKFIEDDFGKNSSHGDKLTTIAMMRGTKR